MAFNGCKWTWDLFHPPICFWGMKRTCSEQNDKERKGN
jgi:hypothetical protein